jgi:hypothetical protein
VTETMSALLLVKIAVATAWVAGKALNRTS